MNVETSIYPYNPELEDLPFLLKGIGGTAYQSHVTRPEGYQWHQILFCAEGEGVLVHDGCSEEIGPNTFIFLPKMQPHEYYPKAEKWEVNWIAFEGSACDAALERLGLSKAVAAVADDSSYMQEIFEKMLLSQQTDIIFSGYTCSGLVYDYILGFRRAFASREDNKRSRQLSMLLPALKYMYDNYYCDIPMSYLAGLIGVTHQHFCRLFKSVMKMSPNDYLNSRRIEEAKRMLKEEKLPVAAVAERCGFHDPGYFSTVFKAYTGVSPSRFYAQPFLAPHTKNRQ